MLSILGEVAASRLHEVEDVDLSLVACGYETRARAFAERLMFPRAGRMALAFPGEHHLAFGENHRVLVERGFAVIAVEDSEIVDVICEALRRRNSRHVNEEVRVFVDISSQSRSRLALVIEAISRCAAEGRVRVFFGYSLAKYVAPPSAVVPNVSIGPVSDFFAGWSKDPELPVSLVLGLGYEPDRAMGAVEYLEPAMVWALLPHSSVSEYDDALLSANNQLVKRIGSAQLVRYLVEDPNATLALLSALVADLSRSSTVLLLPSGPKILVLISLLLCCTLPEMSVWRVSAGAEDAPIDRAPTGRHVIVEAVFSPEPGAAASRAPQS